MYGGLMGAKNRSLAWTVAILLSRLAELCEFSQIVVLHMLLTDWNLLKELKVAVSHVAALSGCGCVSVPAWVVGNIFMGLHVCNSIYIYTSATKSFRSSCRLRLSKRCIMLCSSGQFDYCSCGTCNTAQTVFLRESCLSGRDYIYGFISLCNSIYTSVTKSSSSSCRLRLSKPRCIMLWTVWSLFLRYLQRLRSVRCSWHVLHSSRWAHWQTGLGARIFRLTV